MIVMVMIANKLGLYTAAGTRQFPHCGINKHILLLLLLQNMLKVKLNQNATFGVKMIEIVSNK